ncbi:acyltransferase domain-containing protein [Streptomyces hainanensis]|uniref:Acyltransferase domain-containing protein n=1 Tax=Streptomyces hainanensis TaxID=402648 RepID=A0A4R4TE61_9ACTN|nr:acyltransferase domain-containing protein [Streptomyces hainanensis]TDC74466.1 acyltransferase domain-containing protein [Streptomyces hainanensis]
MGRRIVLLLPGQGAQHQGMGVPLYEREPVFAEAMDAFFSAMGEEGERLRADWLSDAPTVPIDDGPRAQPLLFAMGHAVGRVLIERGLRPGLLLGHSVGELAAAALAGVFAPAAGARILRGRSAALAGAPPGGMLAVAAAPERAAELITPRWAAAGLAVGAVNGPAQTILAGPEAELTLAAEAARAAELTCVRVRAHQPFHSPVLAEAAREFEKAIAAERLRAPDTPVLSARTARTVAPEEAVDPGFWARLMSEPVLFWPALAGLPADEGFLFVDTGPGNGLATIARRHPSVRAGLSQVVPLMPPPGRDPWPVWEQGLATLAAAG